MSATEQPERQFGWWDMFVPPEQDPREQGGDIVEGERATLVKYLRDYRLTLELKCADLDAEAMACRSVPPSNLSLRGLVRREDSGFGGTPGGGSSIPAEAGPSRRRIRIGKA